MGKQPSFETTIKAIWVEYSACMTAGDLDRWIKLWDEDGVQMPPDTPARRGRSTVLREMKTGSVRYTEFAIALEEAVEDRDYGFARGTYTYAFTREGSPEVSRRAGKYLTIFRRGRDGSWRICRDCFNLDAPAR